MRSLITMAAIAALSTASVANAATVSNPASSLSVAKSARAHTTAQHTNEAAGGGLVAFLLLAGVVAIGVLAIVNDSNDSPDSN